jgi:hypothetical protein
MPEVPHSFGAEDAADVATVTFRSVTYGTYYLNMVANSSGSSVAFFSYGGVLEEKNKSGIR